MKEKEFRELQLSSTHLVFIFLIIIVLGVVIFLLGVSVGKRHAVVEKESIAASEELARQIGTETGTLSAQAKPAPLTQDKKPAAAKSKASPSPSGRYYIQVGAYSKKEGALSLAGKYKDQGYPVVVIDPLPTDRNPIFRVRIGGYATENEAKSVRDELIERENKKSTDYFVIRG
jgi:cell division septation protein DedD